MQVKSTQRHEEMEHFLPHLRRGSALSLRVSVYFVIQQSGMLLLPRSTCGLQSLTHLLEGRSIDLAPCIPLAKDL